MINNLPENVLIVYNKPDKNLDEAERLAEADTFDEVNQVRGVLEKAGIKSSIFGLTQSNLEQIFTIKTDLIFNLCYGIGSLQNSETEVYRIYDKLNIPYTGGPGEAVGITNNKSEAKELFKKNGIPTPDFVTLNSLSGVENIKLKYPLLIKTRDLGCSFGMDQKSVATNFNELKFKVLEQLEKFKLPVLIEEYVDGREFSLFILGNGTDLKVFPPVEIVFGPVFDSTHHWKIFDFDAKWNQDSPYCKETPYVSPVEIDKKLENKIKKYCKDSYRLINCNDYARIDLRVDSENNPFILEINLNPSIGHGSQVEQAVKAQGWNFENLVLGIISVCFKRFYKNQFKNARL